MKELQPEDTEKVLENLLHQPLVLAQLSKIREPNEGACEFRHFRRENGVLTIVDTGSEPMCWALRMEKCVYPDTDQTNCPIWIDWNK